MEEDLRLAALEYHRLPTPGKVSVTPTKGLVNQLDLSLAYSPGVAYACTAIHEDPDQAAELTSRANLVAVVSNGTAVLGLGNIGPLASKPVMEGKGCLFKKFAGIDVFDIEISETDPDKVVECVAALEPTFGGINLEDIKAPECFIIERKLRERMKIPVFHDDQHGTAIIVAAAIKNALKLIGKDIGTIRLVASGAGAASLACLDLLVTLGLRRENIVVLDRSGVIYEGRPERTDEYKSRYASQTQARTLAQALDGADVFLGLSAAGALKPEMLATMAENPVVMALANPEPEIRPELAKAARPDALICTGRSDYPNQVNNVLCFPFIFRGALDVGATGITEDMKVAAVDAIANLAQAEASDVVASAYGAENRTFGPDYLIPTPFDPRLIERIAPAVAQAAMKGGVASRPIEDLDAYRQSLTRFVYRSGPAMRPVLDAATRELKRVAFAEGEDDSILRAAQVLVDEGLAKPVIIGDEAVIKGRLKALDLRIDAESDIEIIDGRSSARELGQEDLHNQPTWIAAMHLGQGRVDAMICGVRGTFEDHLTHVKGVIGMREGVSTLAAMNLLMLPDRRLFICDTYVNHEPRAAEVAEIAQLAAEEVHRFGLHPSVALLSHSSFGSASDAEAVRMQTAARLLAERAPDLEVEGEMRGDAALMNAILKKQRPDAKLQRDANVLVMPNVGAANIAYNLLKVAASNNITVGPMLLGTAKPAHILEPGASVRRIVNMAALAAVEAMTT